MLPRKHLQAVLAFKHHEGRGAVHARHGSRYDNRQVLPHHVQLGDATHGLEARQVCSGRLQRHTALSVLGLALLRLLHAARGLLRLGLVL